MNRLQKPLAALVAVELLVLAVLVGWRLKATLPAPPAVELYTDAVTRRELLSLPDRFVFASPLKWCTLGEAYMICGFFSKAEACLGQVPENDSRSAEAALARGYCLERLGLLDEARDEFVRAAGQGEAKLSKTAWYRLGRIFLQLEQPGEALAAFEQAALITPLPSTSGPAGWCAAPVRTKRSRFSRAWARCIPKMCASGSCALSLPTRSARRHSPTRPATPPSGPT